MAASPFTRMSIPTAPSEFLIRGRAHPVTDPALEAAAAASWSFEVDDGYRLFEFDIEQVCPRRPSGRRRLAASYTSLATAGRLAPALDEGAQPVADVVRLEAGDLAPRLVLEGGLEVRVRAARELGLDVGRSLRAGASRAPGQRRRRSAARSSGATTRVTSPIRSAWAASIHSPVSSRCRAQPSPTTRGSR